MGVSWGTVVLEYVCPSLGCLMASVMFAAPVQDLRTALKLGSLKELNPFPWSMMTGNCFGWCIYGWYQHDPFVLAANLPGLILSLWLNTGAAKLQYHQYYIHQQPQSPSQPPPQQPRTLLPQPSSSNQPATGQTHVNTSLEPDVDEGGPTILSTTVPLMEGPGHPETEIMSMDPEFLMFVPQEVMLFRVLCIWAVIVVWVGWFSPQMDSAMTIGVLVNINLVFFYGAPLQTLRLVQDTGTSISIHRPSMYMNWCNTSFWIMYGVAIHDIVIVIPNVIGLLLGLLQGVVCIIYPPNPQQQQHQQQPGDDDVTVESPGIRTGMPYMLASSAGDTAIPMTPPTNLKTTGIPPEEELPPSG